MITEQRFDTLIDALRLMGEAGITRPTRTHRLC